MIDFCDLSLWNSEKQANACMSDAIVAIKATEGKSITDPKFLQRARLFKDKTVIAYHFCRLDKNYTNVLLETENYLNALKRAGRPFVMALDFEGPCRSVTRDLNALLQMLSQITTKTGKEPYVYINESMLTQAKQQGYNFNWLWIAKWSSVPPKYPCGLWQYTNRYKGQNLDRNHFMADDINLLKRHEVTL